MGIVQQTCDLNNGKDAKSHKVSPAQALITELEFFSPEESCWRGIINSQWGRY